MNKVPYCPHCKVMMTLRKGKYGDFFGCTNFPSCKFISKSRFIGGREKPSDFRDDNIQQGDFNTHKG